MAKLKLTAAQQRELTLTEAGRGSNVWRENRVWDTYMELERLGLVERKAGEWEDATLFTVTDAGRAALAASAAASGTEARDER